FEVTQETLESVFHALYEHRVSLEGMLLKPNMVLSGKDCPKQASVQEVAEATVRCMKRVVPGAVPGLVFLSGGQTDQQATDHLNAILTNTHWRFHDLHLPHASGDRARSPGGVPEMRDDSGAEIYWGRGRGTKRDAIVITKILDRAGSYHSGLIAGNGSCHSRF